jgi:UDP-N-acetylmuramoyl-L-alanyl-D-glutamate--2,6-diaminopimelate ligase
MIVNVDDDTGALLAREFPRSTTVGIDADADLRATELRPSPSGTAFVAGGLELAAPLPGRFNVHNALCAVGAARALGVPDAVIEAALPRARTAPGRFTPVDEGQGFSVLVDYAHTPEALANVLAAARGLAGSGRVIVVFGAGGDRDRAKRPLMGAAAAAGADHVIVTSDNPRSEDPDAIIAEVRAGIDGDADVEPDRRAAIARAVALATDGDVVVVAGTGHEQGQEIAGGVKLRFDDVTVAREALRARLDG